MKRKLISLLLSVTTAVSMTAASGTFNIANAAYVTQAYTWNHAQIYGGGYVDGIVFNPGEQNLIYARTDMGGAYRWNQSASEWTPITDTIGFDDWNNLGCDSLAADPVDTDRVYIAAGTYTNNWTASNGCILRSADKGNTWQVTQLPFKIGANMLGRSMGERLAVDPHANNVLYMGTRCGNGLWKSIDYGATWSRVTSFTAVGTYRPTDDDPSLYDDTLTGVVWVTFDPSSSTAGTPCQKIYVGVANDKGQDTIYYTTNGGTTWSAVPGQPRTIFVPDSTKPTVTTGMLPHHGELSTNGMLYITYSDGVGPYDGHKGEVWKYNTATGVWTNISPVVSSSGDNYFGYGGLSLDAQDPNTLIVTTLNSWWPDANVFRSTDGGATWKRFWEWNGYPTRILNYTQNITAAPWLTFGKQDNPPEPALKIGWMMGDIAIDPFNSGRMMYGTGATVYGTTNLTALDSGGTVNLSVMAKGIEQTAVLSLISPAQGTAHLVSGLGDVTGFVHNDLTAVPSMMMISPIFSSTTAMDYAELNPTKYVRVGNTEKGTKPRIGISYDTANNWSAVSNCWTSSSEDQTGGGKVAMSANGNTIVWAPSGYSTTLPVCYSTNGGNSWSQCVGLPAGAAIASDRVNSNKFYGFSGGTFYVSTNGGATFTAAATGLPNPSASPSPETTPVNFKAMPGIEGDIWLAGGSGDGEYGLYHSTNSGQSFTRISGIDEADVVGFGKAAEGSSYMALYISAQIDGDRGIFRSDDVGASWVKISDSGHQYGRTNMCITGDPRVYGRVYVGTNGRGIVYGDISGSVPTSSTITPTTAAFDKKTANQADIPVTMTLNGNTLAAIKNGTATLVSGTDYTVSGSTVTMKKSYLAQQSIGTTTLIFDFSAGTDRTLTISVSDTTGINNSTITPTTVAFDKKTANQADIPVTMTLNGNTLSAVKKGTSSLISGTDYTVSGSTVTIKKSYLAQQSVGTTTLTFDFSAGADPTLAIAVSDTTAPNGNLSVQFYNTVRAAQSTSVAAKFKLTNTGTNAIDLTAVKLRYYYTQDTSVSQNFYCDWSHVGSQYVYGSFVSISPAKTNADTYLEIGFTSGVQSLAAGQSVEVHTRFAKSNWTSYSQSNDYSYDATDTNYADWTNVTAYLANVLAFGVEP